MKLKSYFAGTVAEAIEKARHELGPEAKILSSRATGPEAMHLGRYEVVLGALNGKASEPAMAPAAPVSTPSVSKPAAAAGEKPDGKLKRLFKMSSISDHAVPAETGEPDGTYGFLMQSGFGEELSAEIAQDVNQRTRGKAARAEAGSGNALAEAIASRLPVAPELGRTGADRKIVALVGPPGAGKTTTLVKLAVAYGLTGRRPMHILSMDTYRLGGSDQLRTWAGAMATPFDAVQNVGALSQYLDEYRSKGLILIDTPGYSKADEPATTQLASFLSRHPEADVQVVLPAYMQAADMQRVFNRFRHFLPSKLIFTNCDEAASTGAPIAQAIRTERPVSFLGVGQQVPEDIQPASAERLLAGFLPVSSKSDAESAA